MTDLGRRVVLDLFAGPGGLCAARIASASSGEGVRCLVCVDMASWGRWADR